MRMFDFLKRGRDADADIRGDDDLTAAAMHAIIHEAEANGADELTAEMYHGGDVWHLILHKVDEKEENDNGGN